MLVQRRIGFVIAVTAVAGVLLPTRAGADGLLIESYSGERPEDAGALVGPIRDELGGRQFLAGKDLAEQIADDLSEAAIILPDEKLDEAGRFIESGEAQSVKGNWSLAVGELGRGVELLLSAPVSMVRNQEQRDRLFAGLVALARSEQRLGKPDDARRSMSEVLRTFPERELSRAKYPPDVHKLYRDVKEGAAAQGLGRLTIKTETGVMVFVNERFVGLGDVEVSALPAGNYRVYLQKGERRGRLHRVELRPGSDKTLAIRWALDGALRTDGGEPRFEFESESERDKGEATCAIEVARSMNASSVAVVGVREHDGRRAVIGTVLSMETGKALRSAVVSVEPVPPSDEKIRTLGRFLAGDEDAAKMFEDAQDGENLSASGRHAPSPWYSDTLGWSLAAGGLVLAGVGGGFLFNASKLEADSEDEPDQDERDRLRAAASDRRKIGVVLGITGAAVLAGGIVKLVIHPRKRREPNRSVEVRFGLGSIAVQGRF